MNTAFTNEMNGYVRLQVHDRVGTIEFFHPRSNSLPSQLLAALAGEIANAGRHPDIGVLVLRSAGSGAFCAGASFDELLSIQDEQAGALFFSGFAQVINAMRTCPKFVVARVHGKCVGGGVGLAAAADYAIALSGANIRLSELSIGIGPFVIAPAVERKIGAAALGELAIDSASWRSSDWALQKGLYAGVHPTAEALDAAVEGLANTLAHASPEATAAMKKMLWRDAGNWDQLLQERAVASGQLVVSEYTKKYLQQFQEKRAEKGA